MILTQNFIGQQQKLKLASRGLDGAIYGALVGGLFGVKVPTSIIPVPVV